MWRLFALPIRFYRRFISPLFPPTCKYYPTCSTYGLEALRVHGAFKGTLLTVWRILRCNPWSKGGVDRVPPRGSWPSKPLDHDSLMELYDRESREEDQSGTEPTK